MARPGCVKCPAGQFQHGLSCNKCAHGTYSLPGAKSCTSCSNCVGGHRKNCGGKSAGVCVMVSMRIASLSRNKCQPLRSSDLLCLSPCALNQSAPVGSFFRRLLVSAQAARPVAKGSSEVAAPDQSRASARGVLGGNFNPLPCSLETKDQ